MDSEWAHFEFHFEFHFVFRWPKAPLTELQLAEQLQGFRHVPSTASCTDHGHDIHRLIKSWPSWPCPVTVSNAEKKQILDDSWIHGFMAL